MQQHYLTTLCVSLININVCIVYLYNVHLYVCSCLPRLRVKKLLYNFINSTKCVVYINFNVVDKVPIHKISIAEKYLASSKKLNNKKN